MRTRGLQKLQEQTDAAKDVAAFLIAAAFEDLIRRMGSELAGVAGRPDLQDVVTELKNAGLFARWRGWHSAELSEV